MKQNEAPNPSDVRALGTPVAMVQMERVTDLIQQAPRGNGESRGLLGRLRDRPRAGARSPVSTEPSKAESVMRRAL